MPEFNAKWGITPPADLGNGGGEKPELIVLRQQMIANMKLDMWGKAEITWKVLPETSAAGKELNKKAREAAIRSYQQCVINFNKQSNVVAANLKVTTQIYDKSEKTDRDRGSIDMYFHFVQREKMTGKD